MLDLNKRFKVESVPVHKKVFSEKKAIRRDIIAKANRLKGRPSGKAPEGRISNTLELDTQKANNNTLSSIIFLEPIILLIFLTGLIGKKGINE